MADGRVVIDTDLDAKGFEKGIQNLKSIASSGFKVVGAATTAASAGLVALAKAAIDTGKEFDTAMSQVAATMGTTVDAIPELAAKAQELGASTKFTATEAAEGLNILAMAGLSAGESIAGIETVLDLASAGAMDMGSAATYVTGAVKGFSDSMDNARYYADLMAKGATLANTDVNGLGEALSGVSSTAAGYKQQADSVTLSLLRLADQNITGAEAATALNRAMMDLYTPTSGASKALKELGVSAYDSAGNARDFNTVVDELNAALSGMSDEEANAYKNTIFTTYGLQAFNKMTVASSDTVDRFKTGLAGASEEFDGMGAAAGQAATQLDNLEGDLTILGSAWSGFLYNLYTTMQTGTRGIVQLATDCVTELSNAFESGGLEGLVSAVGSVLAKVVQEILAYVPTLIDTASNLISSFCGGLLENQDEFADAALQIITSLADGMITSGTALASTAFQLVTTLVSRLIESLPEFLDAGVRLVQSIASGIAESLPQVVQIGIELIGQLTQGLQSALPELIPTALNALMSFSGTLRENVGELVDAGLEMIKTLATSLIDNLPVMIETIPTIVTNIAGIINDNAPKLLETGIELIGQLAMGLIHAIPTLVANIPQIIQAVVSTLMAFNWVGLGTNIINYIKDGITSLAASIPNALQNIGKNAVSFLKGINWASLGRDIIAAIQLGIEALVTVIPNALLSIGKSAISLFESIDWISLGVNLVGGIISGITGALDGAVSAIIDLGSSILDGFKGFFGIHSPSTVMTEQGTYLVDGLVNSLSAMPGEMLSILTDALSNVISWGSDMASKGLSAAKETVTNVVSNLSQMPGKAAKQLNSVLKNVTSWASSMTAKAKTAAVTTLNNVIQSISQMPGKVGSYLTSVIGKVTGWASSFTSKAKAAASTALNNVVSQISHMPGKIATQLAAVVTKVSSWGSSLASSFRSIGKNVIQGMINGITSMVSSLYSSIKSALSGLVDKAKNALGIASPSKVMRDEVGQWVPAGIAVGIEENAGAVTGAMDALSDQMTDSMPEIAPEFAVEDQSVRYTAEIDWSKFDLGAIASQIAVGVRAELSEITARVVAKMSGGGSRESALDTELIDYEKLGNAVSGALAAAGIKVEMNRRELGRLVASYG